jgi:hypothetical protein
MYHVNLFQNVVIIRTRISKYLSILHSAIVNIMVGELCRYCFYYKKNCIYENQKVDGISMSTLKYSSVCINMSRAATTYIFI